MLATEQRYPASPPKPIALPRIGLGTRLLLDDVCVRVVEQALAVGYRYIDTAPVYGNEAAIGRALRASGIGDQIFVTTKVERDELNAAALRASVEKSLAALDRGHIDLLMIHWSNADIPLEETIAAMCALKSEGLIRHLGAANFPVPLLDTAIELAARKGATIAANQIEIHPSLPQSRLIEACRERGVAAIAYSPMGRQDLDDPAVIEIARRIDREPAQVVLRWHVQRGVLPIPIPDAATTEQIRRHREIFDFELSASDLRRLSSLSPTRRYFDPAWAPAWDPQD